VIFMGKPKFSRKKYETPSHPWQADRIKAENELSRKYGLKNKREIWKAQTALRRYRGQARELLAKMGGGNPQVKKESEQLLMRLTRMNILPLNSTLDDVLALETEGHYLHVPYSYYKPIVLDDEFEQVGYGESGRFAFLDSAASSYPGFITTGDRVKLLEHCPVCDRPGPVLEPEVKRVAGAEMRGCAEEMRSMMTKDIGR